MVLVKIAFVLAFGVLLDTVPVRSLLVPALAYDIGPRIGWPSVLGRPETSATRPALPAEKPEAADIGAR
jgi:RND superfamily putative drug exporter